MFSEGSLEFEMESSEAVSLKNYKKIEAVSNLTHSCLFNHLHLISTSVMPI